MCYHTPAMEARVGGEPRCGRSIIGECPRNSMKELTPEEYEKALRALGVDFDSLPEAK